MSRTMMLMLVAALVLMAGVSQARYLPTRADDSRLEEVRELLREILERTADGSSSNSRTALGAYGYDKRYIVKRSIGENPSRSPVAPAAAAAAPGASGLGERMIPILKLAQ